MPNGYDGIKHPGPISDYEDTEQERAQNDQEGVEKPGGRRVLSRVFLRVLS